MHFDTEHPHDALFRQIFAEPGRAAELARAAVPQELADAIDWTSLVPLPGTFVDTELREHEADLLFEMRLRGEPALLYLLLEHKSADDAFAVFQMLRYVVRIWERFRRDAPQATSLPPVLPVILHHGPAPWGSPLRLRELVGGDTTPPALRALQPDFEAVLLDLARTSEQQLWSTDFTDTVRLTMLFLQNLRNLSANQVLDALGRWSDLLFPGPGRALTKEALSALFSYLLATVDMMPEDLERAVTERIRAETKSTMKSTAQQLIERGMERGLERGREEGIEQGREQALVAGRDAAARALRQVLEARFGPVPQALLASIAAADLATVLAWMVSAATAADLATVFRDR